MKFRNTICLFILSLVVLSGCSNLKSHPLIFGSHHTFGATVSYSEATGPGLNVGFESKDVAIVPTVFSAEDKNVFALAVRGCFAKGVNFDQQLECRDDAFAFGNRKNQIDLISSNQDQPPLADDDQKTQETPSTNETGFSDHFQNSKHPLIRRVDTSNPDRSEGNLPSSTEESKKSNKKTSTGNHTGHNDQETKSIKDSLSVLSSFGAVIAQGNKKLDFNLGKVYATGAAAQHLTGGMGKKLENEGAAALVKTSADCLSQLNKANGNKPAKQENIDACLGTKSKQPSTGN